MYINDRSRFHEQFGVTVVELLVVIVIIAIIAGIAIMGKGSANSQFKRQNVAQELKVAMERARFDSVKRRAQASPDVRATVVVDVSSYSLTTYPINASGTPTLSSLTTSISAQDIVIKGN